ncbi:MAG TPA: fumarylacetoacetate hydrolase family protein [Burkholderiales bacterium]|nr:fumarylacetoacetate hydrolase family protein [Burkholderiales bacterium]
MRLITFTTPGGAPRTGLVRNASEVIDLAALGGNPPFDPTDMISLIASGESGLAWIRKAADQAQTVIALEAITFLSPIPRPRKNVLCVGWNYLEHFKEGEKIRPNVVEMPSHPTFFSKTPTTVIGPYDPIPYDAAITDKLDWEAELGVIIGPGGKNIAESDAMKHVFGYTVINDVSGRDIQRQHGQQWFKGKSLDGTCPMGPWIVTADEVPNPEDLAIGCRLNGVQKQDSNTSYMYFKIPRIIAELSHGMTLEAGDVISSGTPAGVGHARTPPEFMKPGDVLETEVAGIGVLRNRVTAPES